MKFFKKISPQIPLQLASGRSLRFDNVDGQWGVLKTPNLELISELAACIKNETGGVSEIDEAEYLAMTQKKTTLRPIWREELSRSGTGRPLPTAPTSVQESAVARADTRFPEALIADRTPIEAQPTPAYRPTATLRKTE